MSPRFEKQITEPAKINGRASKGGIAECEYMRSSAPIASGASSGATKGAITVLVTSSRYQFGVAILEVRLHWTNRRVAVTSPFRTFKLPV
jgi:hypothetical protein